MNNKKVHSIGFKVDKELYDRFQRATSDKGINQSFILRQLLEAWILHNEDKK